MLSRLTAMAPRRMVFGLVLSTVVLACAKSGEQGADAAQPGVRATPGDTTELDGRTVVAVRSATRYAVLAEMRTMLRAVQGVVAAAANQDTAALRQAASSAGMSAASETETSVQQELGSDFVMLGMKTHAQFDSLAAEAAKAKDPQVVLRRMAAVMGNCVGCHEQYRLVVK